ncbi:MAG: hypothetical protein Ct9H300mP16_10580 [Pseudomonadota bacterium]|nr:MAG: hypothetical protein Ct9H300mP16_10580 [Pseudomonadota bacterium]
MPKGSWKRFARTVPDFGRRYLPDVDAEPARHHRSGGSHRPHGKGVFLSGGRRPSEQRLWDWLTIHCGVPIADAELFNRTTEIGMLLLAGPAARDVLAACTPADVSPGKVSAGFRRGNCRSAVYRVSRCVFL